MKTHNLKPAYAPSSYRFKSWSRKSYAVFNSLHLIVNIGVLRFDICERLAAKTTKCFVIQEFNPFDAGENTAEDDKVKQDWCVQILTLMPGFAFLLALVLCHICFYGFTKNYFFIKHPPAPPIKGGILVFFVNPNRQSKHDTLLIPTLKDNSGDCYPKLWSHSVDSPVPFYNSSPLTLQKFSFITFPIHRIQISTYTKLFYINSFNLKPNERDEKNYHDDHVVCIRHCRI